MRFIERVVMEMVDWDREIVFGVEESRVGVALAQLDGWNCSSL
jgi:hypothetical protein